jgi:uncharacterized damage-inducible protein DinB
MSMASAFATELAQEAAPTRRLLERIPDAQLAWKPHPKSMSLGELAHHIASLPYGISELLKELDTEVPVVPLRGDVPSAELLKTLDESVAFAVARLKGWGDEGLAANWRMTRGGETLMELPRAAMVRSLMLNHWYHHRGQLTVYLRELDVPLPSLYGPTADEKLF